MSEQMLMKDGLGKAAVDRIALAIHKIYPEFDKKNFTKLANRGLDALELKQRVNHIIQALNTYLPADFNKTTQILCKIPSVWDTSQHNDEDYATYRFAIWPVIDYVSVWGLEHPKASLKTLEKLTPLFSAEFAIRTFIVNHPKLTFKKMESWVSHKNEHVRRLVSEGLRPRLPWGLQLKNFVENPQPIFPFLEKLKKDDSLYVRRSVANNLNDISKDHPSLVINICQKWMLSCIRGDTNLEKCDNLYWIIKHALRSLIKSGNPEVFPLLGYTEKPKITLENLKIVKKKISVGQDLNFSFKLKSQKDKQKIVLDYVIYFVGSNDKNIQNPKAANRRKKVFKLKNLELEKNDMLAIEKKHSFKRISTRKYYPGEHILAILINGIEQARIDFILR